MDLKLCRAMGGWRYEWVATLPRAVYDLLVEDLTAATAKD
jgi:hypothetical protein